MNLENKEIRIKIVRNNQEILKVGRNLITDNFLNYMLHRSTYLTALDQQLDFDFNEYTSDDLKYLFKSVMLNFGTKNVINTASTSMNFQRFITSDFVKNLDVESDYIKETNKTIITHRYKIADFASQVTGKLIDIGFGFNDKTNGLFSWFDVEPLNVEIFPGDKLIIERVDVIVNRNYFVSSDTDFIHHVNPNGFKYESGFLRNVKTLDENENVLTTTNAINFTFLAEGAMGLDLGIFSGFSNDILYPSQNIYPGQNIYPKKTKTKFIDFEFEIYKYNGTTLEPTEKFYSIRQYLNIDENDLGKNMNTYFRINRNY